MKDKETMNLVLIMLVSSVVLIFLYASPKKENKDLKNLTNLKKEIPLNIDINKVNSSTVYKSTGY